MVDGSGRKILIVDDDDFTREMYSDVFRNAGFQVLEAKDGVEGLDMATKQMPDVVFTGIVMPRMDGFTLMDSLKKSSATAKTPVFISSHLGREEDKKEAEKHGARDFIVRDLTSPNEVVEIVSSAFAEGGEYTLQFDAYALDAQRLVRDINLNANYQCLECGEKLILKIRLDQSERGWYKVKFICPNCGWQLP